MMINFTILAAIALSIAWHELFHALALWAVGVPVRLFQIGGPPVIYRRGRFSLGLNPFIGCVGADLEGVPRAAQALYYASGPAGSLLLGIGSILLGISVNLYSLKMLGVVSLAMGVFNLVPIPPLDGYRLVTLLVRMPYRVQVLWALLAWGAVLVQWGFVHLC